MDVKDGLSPDELLLFGLSCGLKGGKCAKFSVQIGFLHIDG